MTEYRDTGEVKLHIGGGTLFNRDNFKYFDKIRDELNCDPSKIVVLQNAMH